MTGAQLLTLSIVVGIIASVAGVYFLAKSQTRESQRMADERVRLAVKDATDPLNATIDRLRRVIDVRDARIESLEDELRRGNRQ